MVRVSVMVQTQFPCPELKEIFLSCNASIYPESMITMPSSMHVVGGELIDRYLSAAVAWDKTTCRLLLLEVAIAYRLGTAFRGCFGSVKYRP